MAIIGIGGVNADKLRRLLFNAGEAVYEDDLMRLQAYAAMREVAMRRRWGRFGSINSASGVHIWGARTDGTDAAVSGSIPPGALLTPSASIAPDCRDLLVAGDGKLIYSSGGETHLFRAAGGTLNAAEEGPWLFTLDDEQVSEAVPGTLPTTNPRWDTLWLGVDGDDTDAETRDIRDGATGALSTSSLDKVNQLSLVGSWTQGAETATPAFDAAIPTDKYAYVSVRRAVGETNIDPLDVAYHAYPMRIAYEDVLGRDFAQVGAAGTYKEDVLGFGGIQLVSAGNMDFYAIPRNMNPACRLLGVAIATNGMSDTMALQLGYLDYPTTGSVSFNLLSAVAGGAMDTGSQGFAGEGEEHWTPAGSNIRLPIWGNGTHYGPLFAVESLAYGYAPTRRLAMRLFNASMLATDIFHFVRFIYAY